MDGSSHSLPPFFWHHAGSFHCGFVPWFYWYFQVGGSCCSKSEIPKAESKPEHSLPCGSLGSEAVTLPLSSFHSLLRSVSCAVSEGLLLLLSLVGGTGKRNTSPSEKWSRSSLFLEDVFPGCGNPGLTFSSSHFGVVALLSSLGVVSNKSCQFYLCSYIHNLFPPALTFLFLITVISSLLFGFCWSC